MTNRLRHATSPYLLQHANNPVAWQPWDSHALAEAEARQVPIFLSIGYSACHWCHVMEHESFEDEATAAFLNAHFVPIKVDREERPDLDDLYMTAVQLLTQRGGWPMSVWLTPDLKPFYGGTYFPPQPRHGMPSFLGLLQRIAEVWKTRPTDVIQDAEELTRELGRLSVLPTGPVKPLAQAREGALEQLRAGFDAKLGGFGPAPKFPPHGALELLLRSERSDDREMALRTLDAMADGGICDQLGGGFARYSVDAEWRVPHFEKMLYDNAQLASAFLTAFQVTGRERFAAVARNTLDYLLRDMQDPAGGFHAAEDADSEGEEGRFYVWRPADIRDVLGEEADAFCAAYQVTAAGTFEHGTSVLHRAPGADADGSLLAVARPALLTVRNRRVRPGKDDKLLASWNGLALSAFAKGAQVLDESRYLAAAQDCATCLQRDLWQGNRLMRAWRGGVAHTPGFLEDYGAVACGLLDLFETDFDSRWLAWAEILAELLVVRFQDDRSGELCTAEADRDDLLVRARARHDNVVPGGATLAIRALSRMAVHTGREAFRIAAERAAEALGPDLARSPWGYHGLLLALDMLEDGPVEVRLPAEPTGARLRAAAWASPSSRRVLRPDSGRQAFLCDGGTCHPPTADPAELERLLRESALK